MHPIAVPQGNRSSAYIKPPKEYLMITQGQQNHTFLSNEDFQDCIEGPRKWYCLPPAILLSTSCELKLLMDSTELNLTTCNIENKNHDTTEWIYLQESDEWIFIRRTTNQLLS